MLTQISNHVGDKQAEHKHEKLPLDAASQSYHACRLLVLCILLKEQ